MDLLKRLGIEWCLRSLGSEEFGPYNSLNYFYGVRCAVLFCKFRQNHCIYIIKLVFRADIGNL